MGKAVRVTFIYFLNHRFVLSCVLISGTRGERLGLRISTLFYEARH